VLVREGFFFPGREGEGLGIERRKKEEEKV